MIGIEEKIARYWEAKLRMIDERELEEMDRLFENIREQRFYEPTSETPVDALTFASWLDPEPLLEVVKESYPYFDRIKDRLPPRIRFLAYMVISGKMNVAETYRSLGEEGFRKLGFKKIVTYEILREFIYERIGETRFKILFQKIVKEIIRIMQEKGLVMGKKIMEDATDIRTLKHDMEAEYSGYYREYGYKADITIEADYKIPLDYSPLGINDDEGKCLKESQENIKKLGLNPDVWIVDMKYGTYENFAHSYANDIKLITEPGKKWKRNPKGNEYHIKKCYQKFHRKEDFKPTNDMDEMLGYLYDKGRIREVGAYVRNSLLDDYKKSPEKYRDLNSERKNKMEGFNAQLKTQTPIENHRPRGWKAFVRRLHLCMLALVFAALIRVQHGVFSCLTSLAYIT